MTPEYLERQARRAIRERGTILEEIRALRALASGASTTVVVVVSFAAFTATVLGVLVGNILWEALK